MRTLVLAEHDNSSLGDATRAVVSAAASMGSVVVLVAGLDCGAIAEEAAWLAPVERVFLADHPALENHLAENAAALIVDLMSEFDAFVAPGTARGKAVAPRVAALLDVMQISDISAVEGPRTFRRPIYAGNAVQRVSSDEGKIVLTVRVSAFDGAGRQESACQVQPISVLGDLGLTELVRRDVKKSDRVELASAAVVVSGGRALRDADTFTGILTPLADRLGAAIGASRAAVDAGYISNEFQVGQTGKIVAPDVYVAIGISGAIQHLAGMKDSKVIVAINSDAEAPIFQIADYGLVGDLFVEVPRLVSELSD